MSIRAHDIINGPITEMLLVIDMYALADWICPDWRDHFLTPHMAVDFYREGMSKREFMAAISDSQ